MADEPTLTKRALDVLTVLASVAGSLGIVWGFLKTAGKPYYEWRKKRQTEIIREILKPQLDALDSICSREEATLRGMRELFSDFDRLMEIAIDNRERLNELNALLDAVGFASRDRRVNEDEIRLRMEGIVETLIERRKERRRSGVPPVIE